MDDEPVPVPPETQPEVPKAEAPEESWWMLLLGLVAWIVDFF